jgi:DNA uptake protein ComE-like DNA-binding protein
MGRHLGKGYSDHLPIVAYFSTKPFCFKNNDTVSNDNVPLKLEKTKSLQDLLDLNTVSKEELMSINGIGLVLSGRIVDRRPYRTVEEP